MIKYAVLNENNVVIELIIADPEFIATMGLNAVPVAGKIGVQYIPETGEWIYPPEIEVPIEQPTETTVAVEAPVTKEE